MKIKYLILSGVIFLVVAISGITLYSCWPAITGTINKNKYYTNQDMEANYEKGFQEGCSNFIELTGQVDYYKDLTDVYYLQILELQDTVKSLESSNKTNLETVSQLENQKQVLESEVANLETNIANNKKTISDLNSQIAVLQTQAEQVPSLNSQIANLQATSLQLQAVNNSNAATITNLNNQIISLNNQISEMSSLTQNAGSQITTLNNRINELQATVSYYESYISQLENTEQAVVTYEVDGEVWEIRIVSKGEISLPVLESTEIKTFNGWKIDGQDELFGDTYTLNTNTKFVADFTYKHAVKFMVDDQVYDNQYVVENESVIIPTAPVKVDYEFLGWSLNGVDIVENIDLLAVTQDVTYQAVFTKIHTVTFMVDDQVIATQKVSNGKCASEVEVEIEEDMVLTGWKINGVIVDVPTYVINADTLFVTEILYKDFVLEYAVYPAALGGDKIWTDGDTIYYSSGTTHCVLDTINYTVSSIEWSGLTSFSGYDIWTDGDNVYYSYNSKQYVLDKETSTWNKKTWQGLTSFSASQIWTDGNNIYYSSGTTQYVLDKETSTWNKKTWQGLTNFYGDYIWTHGDNYYYKDGYVLDIETSTWNEQKWNFKFGFTSDDVWSDGENIYMIRRYSPVGYYVFDKNTMTWIETNSDFFPPDITGVWTDGNNFYCSIQSKGLNYVWNTNDKKWEVIDFMMSVTNNTVLGVWTDGQCLYTSIGGVHRVLDVETNNWKTKVWGNGKIPYDSQYIWTDGNNVYHSNSTTQYVLDKQTSTWNEKTWQGLTSFSASQIWTDGNNIYYSSGTTQYVLDKETSTWNKKTWQGLTNFYGDYIWTHGDNVYYSNGTTQYVLDKQTSTWNEKTWQGLTSFYGQDIWTDGNSIYYSSGTVHYIFDIVTNSWINKEWAGLDSFYGRYSWTDGEDYYIGNYKLVKKAGNE